MIIGYSRADAAAPSVVPTSLTWQWPLSIAPDLPMKRLMPNLRVRDDAGWSWAGTSCDIYWANTVLLLPFDDVDGSLTTPGMTDQSPAAHGTGSVADQAQIDTAQFKFGGSSLQLDGVGDRVGWVDSNDFNLAAGLFTIECWIRPATVAAGTYFIVGQWHAAPNLGWIFYQSGAGLALNLSTTGSNNLNDTGVGGTMIANTWYAVCIDFDGTKYRIYLDGVMVASSTTLRTIFDSSNSLVIGASAIGNFAYNGWIDELRITKGVARYASDGGYTVATAAFPTRAC